MGMDFKVDFPGGKRVDALINGFRVQTDQQVAGGGNGQAPEPFTLFLASMGTCAGIYVLAFCQNRGIDTEGIYLNVSPEVDPEKRLIGKVKIDVIVPDDFPIKYHSALVRSAEQCAVAKHIEAGLPVFVTQVLVHSEVQ